MLRIAFFAALVALSAASLSFKDCGKLNKIVAKEVDQFFCSRKRWGERRRSHWLFRIRTVHSAQGQRNHHHSWFCCQWVIKKMPNVINIDYQVQTNFNWISKESNLIWPYLFLCSLWASLIDHSTSSWIYSKIWNIFYLN